MLNRARSNISVERHYYGKGLSINVGVLNLYFNKLFAGGFLPVVLRGKTVQKSPAFEG
jgi:hypothetical protein